MNKDYILRYNAPAADYKPDVNLDDYCDSYRKFEGRENPWENLSLPLGNGALGANVFGGTDTERIQITENSFANPIGKGCGAGLNNLAEVYISFGHTEASDYERTLCLNEALAHTAYTYGGKSYEREYLAASDRNVLAVRLTAEDGCLGFTMRLHAPFNRDYCQEPGDNMGKHSVLKHENGAVILESTLDYYRVTAELAAVVETDGETEYSDNGFSVKSAKQAVIYIAVGSNYKLCSQVFSEKDSKKKLAGMPHPHNAVMGYLDEARSLGYDELKKQHIKGHREFFDRVSLDIGGIDEGKTTDSLLKEYRSGKKSAYLEELAYHFGRYLLIASCREDTLPPNLQGIWNCYADSPWTAGYWHNVNIQMNYWGSFACNLNEKFQSYVNLFKAFLPLAQSCADSYVKQYFPENLSPEGENGWNIGTGCWPYHIYGVGIYDHSGPGTAAFTAMLFWDYYDYTRDNELLKSTVYPVLYGVSKYLSKIMVKAEGKWLIKYSASPEQWQDGKTYRTTGATFDQQMCFEVFNHTVYAAGILGENDSLIEDLKAKIPLLDPYPYGESGQIKEFREEKHYGDIGEKPHRHISHLLGVYPGVCAPFDNAEFIKAVKTTLELRGFTEIGWAEINRMCVWARIGCSDMAYSELERFIGVYLQDNLWNGGKDAPFQIDGNLGLVAGVNEMLLQSHKGYIELIPNLTGNWCNGCFKGLITRGGFKVSLEWKDCLPVKAEIKSLAGGRLSVRIPDMSSGGGVTGVPENAQYNTSNGCISFDTEKNKIYTFNFGYEGKD